MDARHSTIKVHRWNGIYCGVAFELFVQAKWDYCGAAFELIVPAEWYLLWRGIQQLSAPAEWDLLWRGIQINRAGQIGLL